jgi:adenylate cyclase
MMPAMPPLNLLRLVLWITLSSMLLGALFARAEYQSLDAADVANSYLHGALVGGLTGGALSSLEIFVLRRASGALLRQVPFLVYLGLRSLLYLGVFLIIEGAVNRLMPSAAGDIAPITRADMIFSIGLSLGFNLLFGVNALLGPGVLFAFVAGRYHHPRVEERALLFIDMRSSTAITERLGELRFMDFLNRFIADVSFAIAEAGGEIHKYVGDEVIGTWRLAPGLNEAGCVRACFSTFDRLAAGAADYIGEFGLSADFRAGLHCGPVVVGELGYFKKEIALIGDTMNTAARIEQACRETDCRVLASAALLERLAALPVGVTRRALGPLPMRGKAHAIELYALEVDSELQREPIRSHPAQNSSLATRSS